MRSSGSWRMKENDVRRAYMHAVEFWTERIAICRSGRIISTHERLDVLARSIPKRPQG